MHNSIKAQVLTGTAVFVLAAASAGKVFADGMLPSGGGDTNPVPYSVGATNDFFPLSFVSTSLSIPNPQNLSSFSDLDAAVAAGYDQLTNSLLMYPPGPYAVVLDGGLFTFSAGGELAASSNLFQPSSAMGVTLLKMGVIETQLTVRSWVYVGANNGTNCVAFRTNSAPSSFDAQAWVRSIYGNPPGYLSGATLSQWYADRDRSRAILGMTLINTNDWSALQAAFEAAQANATNFTGTNSVLPVLPADTNRVAFAGIAGVSADGRLGVWIYSPIDNLPVDVFMKATLDTNTPLWTFIGNLHAAAPFTLWHAPPGTSPQAFYHAARADIDSDGDGIPDSRELLTFGTDPYKWDSAGTSLGDFDRMYNYGLNPLNGDINGDGMTDDEAILGGTDPNTWNSSADPDSIRYYYDSDDRLTGTFSGSPAGTARYVVSPAGNHATTAERSAP